MVTAVKTPVLDTTITNYIGFDPRNCPAPDREIGIEIECEGKLVHTVMPLKFWTTVPDGSLRDGIEYVLTKPIKLTDLESACQEWSMLSKGCQFKNSIRTSVHIHVSALRLQVRQVYSVICAYWLLEPILVAANGQDRTGNLHCLRLKDADYLFRVLIRGLRGKSYLSEVFEPSNFKYSSINLAALSKFGSLEFRFIKGLTDIHQIEFWTRLLYSLVQKASKRTPSEVFHEYLTQSPVTFVNDLCGLGAVNTLKGLDASVDIYSMIQDNEEYVYSLVKAFDRLAVEDVQTFRLSEGSHEDLDINNPVKLAVVSDDFEQQVSDVLSPQPAIVTDPSWFNTHPFILATNGTIED